MAKSRLRLVAPATVNRTVTPKRRNGDLRTREYLTETEVDRLLKATKGDRWAHRGRNDDPCDLPPRPQGIRTDRPALASDRLRHGHPPRPQGQTGLTQHSPQDSKMKKGLAFAILGMMVLIMSDAFAGDEEIWGTYRLILRDSHGSF
jgi:hypothetical protein